VTFLNASLLFGLAALAMPLALHLLGRKTPKRAVFPAIRFLRQQHETTRRRLEVRQWVLLALRLGLFAILAIALSQPWLAGGGWGNWLAASTLLVLGLLAAAWSGTLWQARRALWSVLALGAIALLLFGCAGWLARRGAQPELAQRLLDRPPAAVAILLDNSPRMEYRDRSGSRLEQARQWAQWLIDQYPAESRFAVLDCSGRPVLLTGDASAALKQVDGIHVLQNTRKLDERIEAAARVVRASPLTQRVIYVLTDMTAASWDSQRAGRLSGALANEPPVAIQIVDVGNSEVGNFQLSDLQLSMDQAIAGTGIEISGELISGRAKEERTATLELGLYQPDRQLPAVRDGKLVLPEGKVVDRIAVPLSDARSAWRFYLPPLEAGLHHGWIGLAENDPLAIDNRRYFTVLISPPPRIGVLGPRELDRRIIAQALASSEEIRSGRALFTVESQDWPVVGQTGSEDRMDAYVLLDPPVATEEGWADLSKKVQAGSGLMVTLGPALGSDNPALPPAAAKLLGGRVLRNWREPLPGSYLQLNGVEHPALRQLQSPGTAAIWNAFPVYRYWELELSDQMRVLATVASSRQLLLFEHLVGSGRALVMTTPLPALSGESGTWNGLMSGTDAWPMWLLLREAVMYLATPSVGGLNFRVGQPLVSSLPEDAQGLRYQLFGPDGNPVAVEAVDGQLPLGTAQLAGNYWLRGASAENPDVGLSVNLPQNATDLQRLEDQQVIDWLGTTQSRLIRRREDVDLGMGGTTDAQPLYASLILLAVFLWFLEWFVATYFYRSFGKRGNSPSGRTEHAAGRFGLGGRESSVGGSRGAG
jgi:hypothetical protein